jgi:hypothetical protein
MLFIPLILEATGGSWGPQAQKVWATLAKTMAQATGEREGDAVNRIYQSLGLILHRENARAILRRAAPASGGARHILAAAATASDVTPL